MDPSVTQVNRQAASSNGTPDSVEQNAPKQEDGQRMDRAEQLADHLMERAGYYTAWFGRAIARLAARAREEAADIWAEAEHLRRKGRS